MKYQSNIKHINLLIQFHAMYEEMNVWFISFRIKWINGRSYYQPKLNWLPHVSRNIKWIEWATVIYLKTVNKINKASFSKPDIPLRNYSRRFSFKKIEWNINWNKLFIFTTVCTELSLTDNIKQEEFIFVYKMLIKIEWATVMYLMIVNKISRISYKKYFLLRN